MSFWTLYLFLKTMQRNAVWWNFRSREFSPRRSGFSSFWRKKIGLLAKLEQMGRWRVILFGVSGFLIFVIVVFSLYLQLRVLRNLPDVSQIKDMKLTQATIITDRNGVELYKIFDENREYVDLDKISPWMLKAIVAVEDQRFWEHEGLDPMWIFRAWVKAMLGKNGGGGSTLTQQLITNLMKLERPFWWNFFEKVDYKLTQIILAKRLNNVLQQQIRAEKKNLSSSQIKHEMKNKILELYLNYVFLGNNSYGVEAASKIYFNKPAKDLTIMESAILASIPKAPTRYDPYKSTSLLWSFEVKDMNGQSVAYGGNIKTMVVSEFRNNLMTASFAGKGSAESVVRFLNSLSPKTISVDGANYTVNYVNGRAEYVLARMFEDGMIKEEELKTALSESFTKIFEKSTFAIKAPHFVFWIKELLEKNFGSGSIQQDGMIIKTTLDANIQELAEKAIKANANSLFEFWASNSSLLYADSTNGDVLAYVGSLDYFNKDIQGQNDMVKNPRQSGSSIKPLIYALGFDKLPLTLDTPIYDIPFSVGKDTPNNADGKFEGPLPLKRALGFSRNIPAVKMFLALGGEQVAKPFLQSLGLSGVKNQIEYWYPLSLGAAEVSMLELASAYTHLSTTTPAKINPILEIRWSNGTILYTKEPEIQQNIIKPGIVSLMWKILSDPSNRIGAWATKFNVRGLTYALKTGTSNVRTEKASLPRDWWLAAYTPSKVLMMWAGNADARPMNAKAYGWSIHANSVKAFLADLLAKGLLTNEEMPMRDTSTLNISKLSGKLASDQTPADLVVSTLWWNGMLPKEADTGVRDMEVDLACFGKVSPLTPAERIKKWYLIQPSTFMPNKMDLEGIKKYLQESINATGSSAMLPLFMSEPDKYCDGMQPINNDAIQIGFIKPLEKQSFAKKNTVVYTVKSPINIKKILISLDGEQVGSFIDNSTDIQGTRVVDLSRFSDGLHTLAITAIDINNGMKTVSVSVNLISTDTWLPQIKRDQSSVQKLEDGSFNVVLAGEDAISSIKFIKAIDKATWKVLVDMTTSAVQFNAKSPDITVEIADSYGNVLRQDINLNNF